jgi:hypothetical protein
MNSILVGQVADLHFFVRTGSGGHVGDIGETQDVGIGTQAFAQHLAETASGTRQQKAIERSLGVGLSHRRSPVSYVVVIGVIGCRMTFARLSVTVVDVVNATKVEPFIALFLDTRVDLS